MSRYLCSASRNLLTIFSSNLLYKLSFLLSLGQVGWPKEFNNIYPVLGVPRVGFCSIPLLINNRYGRNRFYNNVQPIRKFLAHFVLFLSIKVLSKYIAKKMVSLNCNSQYGKYTKGLSHHRYE